MILLCKSAKTNESSSQIMSYKIMSEPIKELICINIAKTRNIMPIIHKEKY